MPPQITPFFLLQVWHTEFSTSSCSRCKFLFSHGFLVSLGGCHVEICPPSCPHILQQSYAQAILHPFLVGTVLLHHSLGLWTLYQRALGFRLSYRKTVELLYIAIHVTRNLYGLLYGWGAHFNGGPSFYDTGPLRRPRCISQCLLVDFIVTL